MNRRVLFLALGLAACGAPAETPVIAARPASSTATAPAPSHRDPRVGPHGEKATLAGSRVQITSPGGGERTVGPDDLHPPSGDPSVQVILSTALLYLDDGTLLVGVGDGTVTALDGSLTRRWSLGFRGAITGLVPAGEGLVAVTTGSGVLALVTADGHLRWERQLTGEHLTPAYVTPTGLLLAAGPRGVLAYSLDGELAFTHELSLSWPADPKASISLDGSGVVVVTVAMADAMGRSPESARFRLSDTHPPIAGLTPTFPLTYRKVLDGDIVSLLATGPTEILALVEKGDAKPWLQPSRPHELVRIFAGGIAHIALPSQGAKSEVFAVGAKPERGKVWFDQLVMGPSGAPWVLGRRWTTANDAYQDEVGVGHILEVAENTVRERRDLPPARPEYAFSGLFALPILATPDGRYLCFGDVPRRACANYENGGFRVLTSPDTLAKALSVSRVGNEVWFRDQYGDVFRTDGKDVSPVDVPKGPHADFSAGPSGSGVWTRGGDFAMLHRDGARWTEESTPVAGDVVVRAADDAWTVDGRARWDGKRWSLVHRMAPARALLALSGDDVWLGGTGGLWHGTAPGPDPVRLTLPPAEQAIAAPGPFPLGTRDAHHAAERVFIPVSGGEPLTTGRVVSASQDGILWIEGPTGLFEVDLAGTATLLRRVEERSTIGRWFYPEAPGKGVSLVGPATSVPIVIDDRSTIRPDGPQILGIEGGKVTSRDERLDGHEIVALDGNGRGATWAVGTMPPADWDWRVMDASFEHSPHALVRAADGESFRPVLGLPPAAYCDVAAAPDGGAFFAGALNAGPVGEGLLVHARGRLGSAGTTRFRATAALLAVSAVSADEAWAVGAGGAMVHVHGDAVTRYVLPSHAWLRAVFAAGPDDVWVGGDGGTLLHFDGSTFHPVDHPLGARAAFTGIAASRGAVWAVSPSGILRITRR